MPDIARSAAAPVRIKRSLGALNFFPADARDGLGPYLAVYPLTIRHWYEAEIGVAMTVAGLAARVAQTPAGALIDATQAKRPVIVIAALIVTAGSLLLPFLPTFWPGALSQALVGATGSVFAPAIAAITLGIVGHAGFAHRIGRNEAFNHAGNAFAAAAAGLAAYLWGPAVVLFIMAAMILPIRGVLYTFSDNPAWLFGVRLLDGVGAGLFGALFLLIISDLMAGTGRFNVAQGAVTTAQGIGASLSTTLAGIIVVKAGYAASFLVLAGVAGIGLVLFWTTMPETRTVTPETAEGQAASLAKALPSGTG